MRKATMTGMLAVLVLASVSTTSASTVLKTTASSDGEIYYSSGGSRTVRTTNPTMFSYEEGSDYSRTAQQFPLSTYSPTITNATFRFYLTATGSVNLSIKYKDAAGTGTVGEFDYAGSSFAEITPVLGWNSVDVTTQAIDAQSDGYDWIILSVQSSSDPSGYCQIAAYEYLDGGGSVAGDYAPQLVLVPEPMTLTLLAMGGILLQRRRRA